MPGKIKTQVYLPALFFCWMLSPVVFSQPRRPSPILKGEYTIEHGFEYNHTIVGGLSGIEYYGKDIFYAISDDPGEHGPPRFYKMNIRYSADGIQQIAFSEAISLLPPPGREFISRRTKTAGSIFSDAESIRYDPVSNHFFWTSEGINVGGLFSHPFIFEMDTSGAFIRRLDTDPVFHYDSLGKRGLQTNAAFEALALVPGADYIVYSSEKSLIQDVHSMADSAKPIRITLAEKATGTTLRQYRYEMEDVFKNNSNGVVEMLALSPDTFLVLERAYEPSKGNLIRLYEANAGKETTDIKNLFSLENKKVVPLKKRLVLDFTKTGLGHVDNLEGMTWGYPVNGHRMLLFVSDDNFNKKQVMQLVLFQYQK